MCDLLSRLVRQGRACRETAPHAYRGALAMAANLAAEGSTRGGAPVLRADSPRADVVAWLAWNDPNGTHTDEAIAAAPERDGFEPYTEASAWDALASMIDDL